MLNKNKLSDISTKKIENGELENVIPEFYKLRTVVENTDWHNNQNVFDHTLNVMKELEKIFKLNFLKNKKLKVKITHILNSRIEKYSCKELLFFAALMHDIAKTKTIQIIDNNRTSCPEHEIKGSSKFEKIASRFDLSKNEISFIKEIIKTHGIPHITINIKKDKNTILKDFEEIKNQYPKVYLEIILLAMADTLGSDLRKNLPDEFKFRIDIYKEILNSWI